MVAYAAAQKRAFVSRNRVDFEALFEAYRQAGRPHHGILLLFRRTPQENARRLVALLNRLTADELADQLLYLRAANKRRLPPPAP